MITNFKSQDNLDKFNAVLSHNNPPNSLLIALVFVLPINVAEISPSSMLKQLNKETHKLVTSWISAAQ
jgi:hypothetical protein